MKSQVKIVKAAFNFELIKKKTKIKENYALK